MTIDRRRRGRGGWRPWAATLLVAGAALAALPAEQALAAARRAPATARRAPATAATARRASARAGAVRRESARAAAVRQAAPAATVSLVLPLRANLTGLERFAREVSTPGSPMYGRFEPVSVLARRFGASPTARARVISYLRAAGATGVSIDVTGLFADATVRAAVARRLFGVRLGELRPGDEAPYVKPTGTARIPAALRSSVTGVIGLSTRPLFDAPRSQVLRRAAWPREAAQPAFAATDTTARSDQATGQGGSGYAQRTGTASGCAAATSQSGFTPNQYLAAYGYSALHSAGIEGQGERVALIEIDGFRYSDLRHFAECFGLAIPAINGYGVGLDHPLAPGAESTLDLEVLDAAAPRLRAIDVYESRPDAVDVLHSLTAPLRNASSRPDVISASLGSCESQTLETIGRAGLRTVEGALALAAATGISVLASSGDDGSSACLTPGGQPLPELAVSYPASSPWVTGVGGTNVTLNAQNQIVSQQVWNDEPVMASAGGGGQSTLFSRPWYQNGFVSGPDRGVPDVSMLADIAPGYEVYCTAPGACGGGWTQFGGTSAAAPLLAGGIALVDQQLRLQGHQDVGLASPLLYELARADPAAGVISDVTVGDNDLGPSIIGSPLGCCTAGPGYDEASGLGSVDVDALAAAAAGEIPRVADVSLELPRQRAPLEAGRIQARVGCSAQCLAGAYASIAIAGTRATITLRSPTYLMQRAGRRLISIVLDPRTRALLRRALARRRRIVATVHGAIYSAGGDLLAQTPGRRLAIAR